MRYVFKDCTLDTEQYILYRADGPMQLQAKVFQVLFYLLTHRDRVISKQELSEQVWPEQFISDATLEGVIKAVRRAVGDDGRTQWCIQTRRGQGYRFVSSVNIADALVSAPEVRVEPSEATRRQLTVVSCEVADVTRLSQQGDPEAFRDLVRAYQTMCQTVIERFDGVVVQDQGMGLTAYFGYPQAYEDAAYRAVRAGLELVHALSERHHNLGPEPHIGLAIRVGIHTGLVVVEASDDASHAPVAIGAPLPVAALIQRLAEPGTVLMSAATAARVQGLFISREIALPPELDSAVPTPLIQVLRESHAHSRFDVVRSQGLAPLVGREEEFGLLRRRWEQTCQGHGQGILLYGEAGIGKSRLVEALREHVERQAHVWTVLRCTSTTQQSAFYPVVTHLRLHCADLHGLETILRTCGLPLDEVVPLVAPLLSIPLAGSYPPVALPPQVQRRKTLEAMIAWLLGEMVSHPGLVVWEDVHWADPSTLELLSLFLDQIPSIPVLALITFRPSFQPPWPLRSYLTHLAIDRLSRDQVVRLIAHEAMGMPLPDEVMQEVLDKTDGVPLFVEEMMKLILESKMVHQENGQFVLSEPLTALEIPATLQDLLMARLDRLGTARGVLQLGAMLGREFPYQMLQAVATLETAALQEALERLVGAELLLQRGLPPQSAYVFKHALIQETAYQSILKRRRQHQHQRIADVLEAQFPDVAEQQPELLARHYTEAGQPATAVAYWQRAGQAALKRLAYVEAIRHSHHGLALLATLPATALSIQHEFVLQCTLGMAYTATKGFAAAEVEQAYGRALELCRQGEDLSRWLPVLGGLRTFYFTRGDLLTARELAAQQLGLAQQQQHAMYLIQAYTNLGVVLFYLGEFREAREHLLQGRRLVMAKPEYEGGETRDSRVNCLSQAAFALLINGEIDQALACQREALQLAQDLSQPFSLAYALGMASIFHLMRLEYPDAQRYTEATLALSRAQGFASFVATGEIVWHFTRAGQGLGQDDLTLLHQAIAARQAAGSEALGLMFLLFLAEAYQRAGQAEAGLAILAEAREMMVAKAEYAFEAEWYRIQGDLWRQQVAPDVTRAESCFQQAIEVARGRQAIWWELRATTRLCKLWQQQGHQARAYQLLSEVYGRFTEGFDTADLREAHALLQALTP